MYEDHFGLASRPFQLTPDPRFWFETATHRKAMAYLGYGLAQGEGFIVVTGDVGAGKTTLVGHLMERIDGNRINPLRIVSTQVEADDLLRIVAGGLGTDPAGRSKAELLVLIERGLHAVARTGRRTLLIVDEAQALPVSALEELRMLSNFQAGSNPLIQIFLLGQPEFRERLNGSDRLEQLRQRVIATHHLDPMGPDEVEPYVAHRLSVAGWQGRPDFADDAFPALHAASGGVPRRLNRLAGRVLLHCAAEGCELVDAAVVAEVAADDAADLRPPVAEPAAAASSRSAREAPPSAPAAAPEPAEPAPVSVAPGPGAVADRPAEPPRPAARPPRPYLVPDAVADDRPPAPRPMAAPAVTVPTATSPRPIRLAVAPAPAPASVVRSAEAEPAAPAGANPPEPPRPELPVAAELAAASRDDRLAQLEARLEAQDAALRRVLTLLVDWAEADGIPADGRAAA